MPMVPEAAVAMLACTRIGAIHNVVFGGFSAGSVVERMEVSGAKALVTADATMRRGKPTPMKAAARRRDRRPRLARARHRRQPRPAPTRR